MIFVFGSNKAGIHGAGAAREAVLKHGAVLSKGFGHFGNSYAIPTKGQPGSIDRQKGIGSTLSLTEINKYVEDFILYARGNPHLQFKVTQLGCGLAGLKAKDIAPMFREAPDNCYFDNAWFPYLTEGAGDHPQHRYWGTFP